MRRLKLHILVASFKPAMQLACRRRDAVSDIAMSWGFFTSALVLALGLGLGLFWQVVSRREVQVSLRDCQTLLEQQRMTNQQQKSALCELTAAVRAEKAHVDQLQRQVGFSQEEAAIVREEVRLLGSKLADAQTQVGAVRAQYAQLLLQHEELKQAHGCQLNSNEPLKDKFAKRVMP